MESVGKQFFTKEKNGSIVIDRPELYQFLSNNGFLKLKKKNNTYQRVKKHNNTVEEISDVVIKDFLSDYLKTANEKQVFEHLIQYSGNYLSNGALDYLETLEYDFKRATKENGFFYFSNGFIEVTKDDVVLKDYSELDKPIWKSQKKQHNIKLNTESGSDFMLFVNHLAGQDAERFKSLCSIIGYLLHDYKNPVSSKAIIFTDETIDHNGLANGGTGKSLLMKGIGEMVKVVKKDGKNLNTKSNFFLQQVAHDTQLLYFDDVNRNFSFETFYSAITEGMTVEKKYQAEQQISFEESPKIGISSNYPVIGSGGNSDRRRRVDFEVSDYYRLNPSPEEQFGKQFFNEWNEVEWNAFYNFMAQCLKLYLNEGLIKPNSINIEQNKLISLTDIQFVEFAELELSKEGKYDKDQLLMKFYGKFGNRILPSSHIFTKWISAWAEYQFKSLKIEQKQSNGKNVVTITHLQQ